LKTSDFDLQIDFEKFRSWLQQQNISTSKSTPAQSQLAEESVDIASSLTFDLEQNQSAKQWIEAKRAKIIIRKIQIQEKPVRIRGLSTYEVLNTTDTPFLEFDIEIEFETERGPIQVSGNLIGAITRWEGELTSRQLEK